jgi:hypothetical protein
MKRITWCITVAVLLVGCAGMAAAQSACAGLSNPGGFDLFETPTGSSADLSSLGLGTVNFQGLPLPTSADAGFTDTIVCRITPLPQTIPPNGATLQNQIVVLSLQNTGTVICNNPSCGSFSGQPVTVYATINQTNGVIPTSQLPVYDTLNPSTGTMVVFPNFTFNTPGINIQADIIVVPLNQPVTYTPPIFTAPMPSGDSISATGTMWGTAPPPGYPDPPSFPSGNFFVTGAPGGTPARVAALLTTPLIKGLLYGFSLLLVGIAVVKIRVGVNSGRLNMRPVYLLGLFSVAWLLALSSLVYPTVAHANMMHSATAAAAAPNAPTSGTCPYRVVEANGTVSIHGFHHSGCGLNVPTLPPWSVVLFALILASLFAVLRRIPPRATTA